MGAEAFGRPGATFTYAPHIDLPGVAHTIEWFLAAMREYQPGIYNPFFCQGYVTRLMKLVRLLSTNDVSKRPSIVLALKTFNQIVDDAILHLPTAEMKLVPLQQSEYKNFATHQVAKSIIIQKPPVDLIHAGYGAISPSCLVFSEPVFDGAGYDAPLGFGDELELSTDGTTAIDSIVEGSGDDWVLGHFAESCFFKPTATTRVQEDLEGYKKIQLR